MPKVKMPKGMPPKGMMQYEDMMMPGVSTKKRPKSKKKSMKKK